MGQKAGLIERVKKALNIGPKGKPVAKKSKPNKPGKKQSKKR